MLNARPSRLPRLCTGGFALALALLFLGCTAFEPTRVGSGEAEEETRPLAAFEHLGVSTPARISVRIGPSHQVRLAFDDNLLPHVETVVAGGRLEIRLAPGARYRSTRPLLVEVETPGLTSLSIAGAGEVDLDGLAGPRFALSVSGAGRVRAGGQVDELAVSITGSGELDLGDLVARRASVDIAGSGAVEVHALEALHVSSAGSGAVRYRGQPELTSVLTGSGSVTAIEP